MYPYPAKDSYLSNSGVSSLNNFTIGNLVGGKTSIMQFSNEGVGRVIQVVTIGRI